MAKARYAHDQIVRAINEGKTYTEIASMLGCDRGTVSDYCRRIGIAYNPNDRMKQRCLQIQDMLESGMPAIDIAQEIGCSLSLVYKVGRECGHKFDRACAIKDHGDLVLALARQGESYKVIARKFGVSDTSVSDFCRRFGIDKNRDKVCVCGEPMKAWAKRCPRCAQRVENQARKVKRRVRIKEQLIDKDITVFGLYKRDSGRCWLCGGECDFDDKVERSGVIVCGDRYPSIDHVLPLSKGGEHSWRNVKLAHRICNSIKSDSNPPASRF